MTDQALCKPPQTRDEMMEACVDLYRTMGVL